MVLALAKLSHDDQLEPGGLENCPLPLEHSVPLALEYVSDGRDGWSCGARDFGLRRRRCGAAWSARWWPRAMGISVRTKRAVRKHILAFRSVQSYQFLDEMDSAREIYMQVDPRQALLVQAPDDEKVHVTLERGSGIASVTSVQPRSIESRPAAKPIARSKSDNSTIRHGRCEPPQLKSSCTPVLPAD